jgi:hypothetical protein
MEPADQFASFDHDLGSFPGLGEVVGVTAGVLLAVKRCKGFVETLLVYIPLAVCSVTYPKNDVAFLIESHIAFPFYILPIRSSIRRINSTNPIPPLGP